MWNRPDEYAFMTAERFDGTDGMGMAPQTEFPFVGEGGVRNVEGANALKQWAVATATHHAPQRPWHPNFAPLPPGYQAPFRGGLFGLPGAPVARRARPLAKLGLGLLGAFLIYKGLKSPRGKRGRNGGLLSAGAGLGLAYTAWRI